MCVYIYLVVASSINLLRILVFYVVKKLMPSSWNAVVFVSDFSFSLITPCCCYFRFLLNIKILEVGWRLIGHGDCQCKIFILKIFSLYSFSTVLITFLECKHCIATTHCLQQVKTHCKIVGIAVY